MVFMLVRSVVLCQREDIELGYVQSSLVESRKGNGVCDSKSNNIMRDLTSLLKVFSCGCHDLIPLTLSSKDTLMTPVDKRPVLQPLLFGWTSLQL